MSLTGHLKDPTSQITQFIRQRFPQTSSIMKMTNKHLRSLPPISLDFPNWVYGPIGMAIDYRIRYSFAITPSNRLVAWRGARELCVKEWESDDDIPFDWNDVPTGMGIPIPSSDGLAVEVAQGPYPLKLIFSFFGTLNATLETIQPVGKRLSMEEERVLARYCFVLALFEQIFRSGRHLEGPLMVPTPKKIVEELLAIPEDAWVDDISALSWLFYDKCSHLLSQASILNPTFAGSGDVGGADADLIVNGCLFDMKTTKQANVDPNWLRQLIGYLLLDYDDTYHIDSVAIYMARQGEVFTWSIPDFLCQLTGDSTTSLTQLRQEFRTLLQLKRLSRR